MIYQVTINFYVPAGSKRQAEIKGMIALSKAGIIGEVSAYEIDPAAYHYRSSDNVVNELNCTLAEAIEKERKE